jgi:hypothetical protein
MPEVKTQVQPPKAKLLVETLTQEDKLALMEQKRKAAEKKNKEKEEKKEE